MLTRRYSSKPVNALQVGNPAYAMELKALQTRRKAKPMTLSSLVTDPFGVSTAQAFYPGKVRSAKNYRNTSALSINSSSSSSKGTCTKCSGKTKTSAKANYLNASTLAGNSARALNGSARTSNGSVRTSNGSDRASNTDSGISSVAELDRLSQTDLADYVLKLEKQVTQSCGGNSLSGGGVNPVSSGDSTGATPTVAQNQAPASSCCCCTCNPSAQTQPVAPPQTIAGGYTPPPSGPSSDAGQSAPTGIGWGPTGSIVPGGGMYVEDPATGRIVPRGSLENTNLGEQIPNAGVNYTPGYNAVPGGISYNKYGMPITRI